MSTLLYSADQNLLNFWNKKVKTFEEDHSEYATGYKDALKSCILDLSLQFPHDINPFDLLSDEELKDYAMSMDADTWGSLNY